MKIETRTFHELAVPGETSAAIARVELQVNVFLSTMNLNDVIDVRYQVLDVQERTLISTTVIYLT